MESKKAENMAMAMEAAMAMEVAMVISRVSKKQLNLRII